ncbi:MAG: MobQ family relaxase [Rhodanobacter sp.]
MAVYRCEVKTVSRSQGGSAVAGAAYRAGLCLVDDRTQERHDYTRKAGVVASEVLAPDGAPDWAHDPGQLWNAAEAAENRKNSVVAREFLVSLPHELDEGQRVELARDITRHLVERFGFAAMFAVHAPDKKGDDRNHHAHILATTRAMGPDGLGAKTRELDDRKTGAVDEVRAMVGATINAHLARAGLADRVDHRSLADRQTAAAKVGDFATVAKLERKPEPKIGRAATAAARAGKRSPRFSRAEITRRENEQQAQAQADRFRELKTQAQAEGRLTPADEQNLHARALLERHTESADRLRLAATRAARTPTTGAQTQAAPPTRAPRQAREPQASRAPAGHLRSARAVGNGTKEGDKAAKAANEYIAMLDEVFKDMAEAIRKAAAWAQDNPDPWPRALARNYLRSAAEAGAAKVAHVSARDAHRQAKRGLHEADHATPTPQGLAKAARRLGWIPKNQRDLEQARREAQDRAEQSKAWRHESGQIQKRAEAEAKKHEKALLAEWEKAQQRNVVRFPEQQTPAAPVAAPAPTLAKHPGSGSGFQPPRLEPPKPSIPKIRR